MFIIMGNAVVQRLYRHGSQIYLQNTESVLQKGIIHQNVDTFYP